MQRKETPEKQVFLRSLPITTLLSPELDYLNRSFPRAYAVTRLIYHRVSRLLLVGRIQRHPDTQMTLKESGIKKCYRPTFSFPGSFINRRHTLIPTIADGNGQILSMQSRLPEGNAIEGWLWAEDALKLYEIAFYVRGDVLELGAHHGLSTCILSQANHDSPYRKTVYSVDISQQSVDITRQNLVQEAIDTNVIGICSDASAFVDRMIAEGKRFDFVFVDHCHSYEAVYAVSRKLGFLLTKGGFCLFHDFNDSRNRDSANTGYGVYQGVMEGLDHSRFEFLGAYGCTALFRARTS